MADKEFKPYVPAKTDLKEFTLKAVLPGALFAIILGAANAYLGLKVGLTVAATFPAAVMAMAILKPMKGTVLEENIFRTTAAVGEALVAGAIFTLPAFIISGVWEKFHYLESTALLLLGGILGVLFVIFLRRALIEDKSLQFPESVACAEIVKAGQKGKSGAGMVFAVTGLAALIQLFKDSNGIYMIQESVGRFVTFAKSKITFLTSQGQRIGEQTFVGGAYLQTPNASPAMLGVGYIIGPRLSSVIFSGGVFAWLLLVPLLNFIYGPQMEQVAGVTAETANWATLSNAIWFSVVRPLAVGAMLLGSIYTLYKMRKSLLTGIARVVQDIRKGNKTGAKSNVNRLDEDLPYGLVVAGIVAMVIPIAIVYYFFCKSVMGAIMAALVMTIAGFLFAAVAGFLVGTIGSSNNPISGLTLTTLIIAAAMMLIVGVKGDFGVAAVLGVAAVVCCSSGVAGDIMQDLKVGQIIGGTPKKMEIAVIIGVIAAAVVMVIPMQALHDSAKSTGGIGGDALPAPQAGLMAMLSKGIIGGDMAWPLILIGIGFTIGMILIKSPSPMLIAVGMYLPLASTFGIFIGGVIKWVVDAIKARRKLNSADSEKVENKGVLLASGLIAGEALMGMIIAVSVALNDGKSIFGIDTPKLGGWGGLIIFAILTYLLINLPLKDAKKKAK
jgi:putative OPT family oligopeptide transporter